MIKNVHKWEKAVILLLNADGWDLTHTGKGFEHYDAIGYAPEKNGNRAEVVIEFKFRNKYYKEKMLEVYKYDKLIETGRIALYFVNDPKGNYMFWLNTLKDLKNKCRKYINTKRDKKGGDNMASKGIVLPLNELL